jgi:hypothetical protein
MTPSELSGTTLPQKIGGFHPSARGEVRLFPLRHDANQMEWRTEQVRPRRAADVASQDLDPDAEVRLGRIVAFD